MRHFVGCGQSIPSLFKFQSQVPSHNPRAVKHYYPLVSSAECSPPGTDASGWLVCLAAGPSPATTSTWPEFSPVEGYNSPKVAGQTIVYATAHYCQVKGKRARQWRNIECSYLQLRYASGSLGTNSETLYYETMFFCCIRGFFYYHKAEMYLCMVIPCIFLSRKIMLITY